MSTATLQLFRCEPYSTRMTPRSCGTRFRHAKAAKSTSMTAMELRHCRGCEVGKAHAAGGSPVALAPLTVVGSEHVGGTLVTKRARAERACKCGTMFLPRTATSLYCDPDCSSRPVYKSKPAPKKDPRRVCPCGTGFKISGSRESSRKYCSDDCPARDRRVA